MIKSLLHKQTVFVVDADKNLICYGIAEDAHKLSQLDQEKLELLFSKSLRKANRFLKKKGLRSVREITDKDCRDYKVNKELPRGALLAKCDLTKATPV